MTNILKATILSLAIAIMFFAACKKTSNGNTDTTKPVISVLEPTANDTLSLAVEPEVHLEFTVTDEVGLHSLSVQIIKNGTETLLNENPAVMDLKAFVFHEHVIPSGIISITSMKAIIRAEDHGKNVETKTIEFYVKP